MTESFNAMVESVRNYVNTSDLTEELRQAYEELEELKQKDLAKDEFIKVAAHELRNPIQPIY